MSTRLLSAAARQGDKEKLRRSRGMADLIAVLDHGQLTECGTHRELMTAPGLYAELFTLQARAYH